VTNPREPTDEDLDYARTIAEGFAGGDRAYTATMAAHLMATNLDGIDGEQAWLDDFRIRRARAFGRVWQEHTR
jgi:hypothetical protein